MRSLLTGEVFLSNESFKFAKASITTGESLVVDDSVTPLPLVTENAYGKGKVIVIMPSWLITLINNKGVYKDRLKAEIIYPEMSEDIELILEEMPQEVNEWLQGVQLVPQKFGKNKVRIDVTIPAGDVRVVEIKSKEPGPESS